MMSELERLAIQQGIIPEPIPHALVPSSSAINGIRVLVLCPKCGEWGVLGGCVRYRIIHSGEDGRKIPHEVGWTSEHYVAVRELYLTYRASPIEVER